MFMLMMIIFILMFMLMMVIVEIIIPSDSGQPHKPYYRDLSEYGELLRIMMLKLLIVDAY